MTLPSIFPISIAGSVIRNTKKHQSQKHLMGVDFGKDEDSKIYFAFSKGDYAASGGTTPGGSASKSSAYVVASRRH